MRITTGLLLMLVTVACSVAPAGAPTAASSIVDDAKAPTGMPSVDLGELPPEGTETLALIDSGGPFPYRQDGAVFENREGLLPDGPSGYFREYTVETPGSDDRGARRIVAGADGERYWTDDHYDSFSWIER
jgi:ribonuclease T1